MSDRYVRFALALILLAILATTFLFAVSTADAGRPPPPSCWWDGNTLHAIDLPDEWSMTVTPHPAGMSGSADTFTATFAEPFTVYVWTRGGPYEALFKPGRQLNDYKPVCIAVP